MSESQELLAKSLNDRKASAVYINQAATRFPANCCHDNVKGYLKDHPDCAPVRGWLVEEFDGFTYFDAHSVVRQQDGTLLEITMLNRKCSFIEHEGTAKDFTFFGNRLQYPPVHYIDDSPPVGEERDDKLD